MRFPKISFKIHALSQVRWKNNPTPPRKTSTMAKNLQTYVSCFVEAILRYSFSLPFRVLAFLVFGGSKKTHPWFLELEWDIFGQNSIFQNQQKKSCHVPWNSYHLPSNHLKHWMSVFQIAVASCGGVCYDDLQGDYTKTGRILYTVHAQSSQFIGPTVIHVYMPKPQYPHERRGKGLPARKKFKTNSQTIHRYISLYTILR